MAITPLPTTRQTIPYGDRPFVDAKGFLTQASYQFLERLSQGFGATVTNVTTVIANVNTLDVEVATLETDVTTIEGEIAAIQNEISQLGNSASPPALPPLRLSAPVMPPAPPQQPGLSLQQAMGIAYFFGG